MDVIYFITPTVNNFKLMMQDFPDLNRFKPKYRAAHVFMSAGCPQECLNLLTLRKDVVQRISTFTELHLDFIARDERYY